ncbi:hypothetical protein JCM10003_2770 [Bacteroides pyogenes JCM 10003]|nr:hypothetical protein JCM10003_2770 [Bacteroides pyogenes JCM 10003]
MHLSVTTIAIITKPAVSASKARRLFFKARRLFFKAHGLFFRARRLFLHPPPPLFFSAAGECH